MAFVLIALGSNVGDPLHYLQQAVAELKPVVSAMRCSRIYESRAVLPEGAPPEWDMPYLNMALAGESALAPEALLTEAKRLEVELGRKMRGHWGPREIDIDIVAYGDLMVATPQLTLPHPRMAERNFVLLPLAEIAPHWRHPVTGPTVEEMVVALKSHDKEEIKVTDFFVGAA